ncbi:MAG TPA: 4'-phosphopantetheinyl transferase superfamily protein [Solirubrobacteraceae bacterium]|nr:4'-phosphopantetheinyl transferase superfamily protein [Solirubrobacteraceae bacterium]
MSARNDGDELFFNVSHSGPLALLAFTRAGDVGIDVELPRPRTTELSALAGRVLGPAEGRRIQELPEEIREREVLRGWVRHEALLKHAGGPPGQSWLGELDPGGEATAAVALDRAPTELRCWEWSHGGARPHDC